jgi:hypothetical protein
MLKREFVLRGGLLALLIVCAGAGCAHVREANEHSLVGAWRGRVQFSTGAFAATTDLEFLYVFNEGGTMTESSNYDGAPPVAPAYGVWRKVGERKYQAKYIYFWTKAPADVQLLLKGGGWSPGGHGLLTQQITVSADGRSFDGTINYQVFDQAGKPTEKDSAASAQATKISF